MGHPIPFVPFF